MSQPAAQFPTQNHRVDVAVIGGGIAGLCAAIASARQGRKTILVQDRPVLGGNASSEVRMWICGARGKEFKETGILEEIQLDNALLNPSGNYSIWDGVLWHKATSQPNLTLLLNCSVMSGDSETIPGDASLRRITRVRGWQLTSQTFHDIEAKIFIDCSGDSILAPISGAATRWGREARHEFDEDIQPPTADRKTMGNTLLIQLRKVDEDVPFTPPPFAYRFDSHDQFAHRLTNGVQAHNFWWLELGGLQDTIRDAESIRDELMRTAWGAWDFIKNRSPHREQAARWAIEWVGALPGKRENRRYVGLHTLSQNEVRAAGKDYNLFEDAVAYGGWSMDDHHPAGMLYPAEPTVFHPVHSPYVIPYRCLVSSTVVNLMMAGRNISVTHAALSSTRVMATCALLGQAAGTAAAMAIARGISPQQIFPAHISALQHQLQRDDVWLPGRTRAVDEISRNATSDCPDVLAGVDRPLAGNFNGFRAAVGQPLTLTLKSESLIAGVRFVFDSNLLNEKRMPCSYPQKHDRSSMPPSLAKRFSIEVQTGGNWKHLGEFENAQRLHILPIHTRGSALRVRILETWGGDESRIHGFEAIGELPAHHPVPTERVGWSDVVARVDPKDLEPPVNEGDEATRRSGFVA